MPRNQAPHFKVRFSAQNHSKLRGLWDDDALLAMWVRAGVLAMERYADRTGDTCQLSQRDLLRIAATEPFANALRKLLRLVAATPLRIRCGCAAKALGERCECAGYSLTFPNLAEKQFPRRSDGTVREGSASASASASASNTSDPHIGPHETEARRAPGAAPDGALAARARGPKPRKPDPRIASAWTAMTEAFTACGRDPALWRLTPARQRAISARLAEGYEPADLALAVRGYRAMHASRSSNGDFDPEAYFAPDTILRPTKFASYVEAARRSAAQQAPRRDPDAPLPRMYT
ncbi:MAG TPA: hypothetical protein VJ011_05625 [Steroidobacteraceae bacterium]|nr:hypothetical protein [Steroidobacteraceae bacterium]